MRLQAFIALNLSFLLKDPKILQFLNNLCRILIAKPWFFKIFQEHLGISLSKKIANFLLLSDL